VISGLPPADVPGADVGIATANLLTVVGLALTLIAFLTAIYQVWQTISQSRRLTQHEQALGTIAESLSTRYLGPFPEYLPTVTSIVGRSKSDILIVNDNPTPAYFSAPLSWIEYRHAIATKMHSGVAVTLISLNDRQRLRRMQDQFTIDGAEWSAWCKSNSHLIQTFLAQQYPANAGEPLELARFLQMLVETQARLCAELFGPASRIEIDSVVTLQVWIIDKREAVFSIETTNEHSLSHGLYTSDPKFVAALYAMAELYRSPWTGAPN